jgi:hypothetical protein
MSYAHLPPDANLAEIETRMQRIQREHHVAGRTCGECTACCTTLQVVELNKPINTPCPHCTTGGCGIYVSRPPTCRVWSCEWWLGRLGLTDAQRPDKLGLMFTFDPGSPLIAYELLPGAAATKKALKVLNRLARDRPLLVQRYGTHERVAFVDNRSRDSAPRNDLLDESEYLDDPLFNLRRPQ